MRSIHAVTKVEKGAFLLRIHLIGSTFLKSLPDGGIDEAHGPDGVGAKGDTRADLGECVGGLVDVDGHTMVEETNG